MSLAPVIAIDGPSGSGKSSTSRGVAERLGFAYLDTGAMYRAVAWAVLDRGVDPSDGEAVARTVDEVDIAIGTDPSSDRVLVDGTDVTQAIRGDEVTSVVSPVATVPHVRELLVAGQRSVIASAEGGIVVEGRDIGTVVAPDAPVKVYLVADAAARAARRAAENGSDAAATAQMLAERDRIDSSRTVSPLAKAEDAVVVDGTFLSLDEVVAEIVALARRIM